MKEKFKTLRINGIDTDYVISNFGRVFTKDGEREKATEINKVGYRKVALQINGRAKLISVHRAVYESFVGDIPPGMHINHKDGDKLNNNIKNLELATPSDNAKHAWRTGLAKKQYRAGDCNPHSTHTKEEAIAAYALLTKTNLSHKEIAKMLGVDKRFVMNVSMGLWGEITGFDKKEVSRNHKFTKKEELIIWSLYRDGYRTKDLVKLMGIDKDSINNKLGYIKRNNQNELNAAIETKEVKRLVTDFLNENEMFCIDFGE